MNPGNEVFTVSKFLIFPLMPVSKQKITEDIQILWSPFVFIKINNLESIGESYRYNISLEKIISFLYFAMIVLLTRGDFFPLLITQSVFGIFFVHGIPAAGLP